MTRHRGVFWSVESQTGLYAFFKTVCDLYDLLPAENYKLPPEAEGLEADTSTKEEERHTVTSIVKSTSHLNDSFEHDDDRNSLHARRSNTARHSSRPSTGSAVTTVIEEGEDEHLEATAKLKDTRISSPSTVEEESEVEVPVIVEGGMINQPTPTDAQIDEPPKHIGDQGHSPSDAASGSREGTQKSEDVQDQPLVNQELLQEVGEPAQERLQPATDDDDKQTTSEVPDPPPNEEDIVSTTAESSQESVKLSQVKEEEKPAAGDPSTG
ncbi:hypothetical protein NUW58_g9634 [Xylaria curta]|uniref:Uncharacterized protein n=1 Tax=Xylaria curta TaxID=42375 RepID=A0ACC1MWK6_9PEZI|nr:hypothetical protein NUW58_g9634 [Xylaria curta]